jgi:hypothetical protein
MCTYTHSNSALEFGECTPPVAYRICFPVRPLGFCMHHWRWWSFVATRADVHDCIKRSDHDMPMRYSSEPFANRHWKQVGGKHHAPAALSPGKTRYPLYRRLGEAQDRSGQMRKVSPPNGIRYSDRPARSQSLYRLRYPAQYWGYKCIIYNMKC